MNRTVTLTYTCPACDAEIELDVYPGRPGRFSGPPEDCYPDEPTEYEPGECECGREINPEDVDELLQDAKDAADEARAEAMMEAMDERKYDEA